MGQTEIIKWTIELILALLICFGVTGCFSDRGWDFHVGVTPVSRVDNKLGLDHTDLTKKEKY